MIRPSAYNSDEFNDSLVALFDHLQQQNTL